MAKKKKRTKQDIIFVAREGDREENFLRYLQEIFDPDKKKIIKLSQEKGGNSNAILDRALKNNFYTKVYAWFDEDDELDKEHREELEKCWNVKLSEDIVDADLQKHNTKHSKPIIIVSNPYSIEAMIIKIFDKNMPTLIDPVKTKEDFEENKKRMKSSVKGFLNHQTDIEYYRENLTREKILEKAETIYELKLLLSIFDVEVE